MTERHQLVADGRSHHASAWRRGAEEEHRIIDWRFRVDDARRVFRYEGLTARRSEH